MPRNGTPIRLLIVDDHAVVRCGLRLVLETEPDLEVVGEAASVEQAIAEACLSTPDVIVMDVLLPGKSGIDGRPTCSSECPRRVS